MADYTPPPGVKNRKKDKDPNKPKRNMSAYFSYDATTNTKDDAILSFASCSRTSLTTTLIRRT